MTALGIDLGNAKMTAEMDEIERAQQAGDFDDVHIGGSGGAGRSRRRSRLPRK